MQIWSADLERSAGKCRYRPSVSDCLRRPLSAFSVWSRWLFPFLVRGCHLRAFFPLRVEHSTFNEREVRGEERKRGVVMLFYATRSLILSIMLAGRISVQAINEKAPAIDHVGPWFVSWVFCLCGCPNHKQSRARIGIAFPFLSATRLTTFSRLVRSFSTSPGQNFSHQSRSR